MVLRSSFIIAILNLNLYDEEQWTFHAFKSPSLDSRVHSIYRIINSILSLYDILASSSSFNGRINAFDSVVKDLEAHIKAFINLDKSTCSPFISHLKFVELDDSSKKTLSHFSSSARKIMEAGYFNPDKTFNLLYILFGNWEGFEYQNSLIANIYNEIILRKLNNTVNEYNESILFSPFGDLNIKNLKI